MQRFRNQVLIGMAFMAAVLIAVVLLSNARELGHQLGTFPRWLFMPIIMLKVVNWILRYLEWHYFLHVIEVYPVIRGKTSPPLPPNQPATIRVSDSFILWMASLPFALSPGKIAEVLKALILKSMTHTPVVRSAPIIFAERIVDGIAVILLVGLSAMVAGDAIFQGDNAPYIRGVLVGTVLFLLALIGLIQFRPLAQALLNRLHYLPLLRRFQGGIQTLYNSSYDLAQIRHLVPTTLCGLGAYFTDCVGFYLMLIGLGEPPSAALFAQAVFILGFSVVISALSAMPGGAGGRELTIGALLKTLVGMSPAATGAAVLMIGILQVWFGAFIGISLALIFRKRLFPPSLVAELQQLDS